MTADRLACCRGLAQVGQLLWDRVTQGRAFLCNEGTVSGVGCLLPFEWALRPESHNVPTAPELWALAAASGVVQYAMAFSLYMVALKTISASVAGSFLNLVPLFGFAGAFVFLREAISTQQLLGAVITVGAVTLMHGGMWRSRVATKF